MGTSHQDDIHPPGRGKSVSTTTTDVRGCFLASPKRRQLIVGAHVHGVRTQAGGIGCEIRGDNGSGEAFFAVAILGAKSSTAQARLKPAMLEKP